MSGRYADRTRPGDSVALFGRKTGLDPGAGLATPAGYNTTNLVQWFDAGVNASYPGTGTTITDLSGANNHGTLVNGAEWRRSAGNSKPGFVLDGTNDYISTTYVVPNAGPVTHDMWVFMSPGYKGYLFGMAIIDTHGAHYAYIDDASNVIYSGAWGGGGNPLSYSYTVANPGWVNLTFTYHSSATPKRAIYVNGAFATSTSGFEGSQTSTHGMPWGSYYQTGGTVDTSYTFNGHFGMMSRYSRILSGAEITSNYNAYSTRFL